MRVRGQHNNVTGLSRGLDFKQEAFAKQELTLLLPLGILNSLENSKSLEHDILD